MGKKIVMTTMVVAFVMSLLFLKNKEGMTEPSNQVMNQEQPINNELPDLVSDENENAAEGQGDSPVDEAFDPKYPEETSLVYYSKEKMPEPEYRKMVNRYMELKAYKRCKIKDTPAFQKIESLLQAKGYDKTYVRATYEAVYDFWKTNNREVAYENVFPGTKEVPARRAVIDNINKDRAERRKLLRVQMLQAETGIEDPELMDNVFAVEVYEQFTPARDREPKEGEMITLEIE